MQKSLPMIYDHLLRPLIFSLWNDPEDAHEFVMANLERITRSKVLLGALRAMATVNNPRLEREFFGLRFPNPVGLAGGFDKNARAIRGFEALGFGFIEIGTVTWHPQPGNPRQRVFRYPEDEAIINRFGFNNDGAQKIAERLAADTAPRRVPLGVSLGKSKVTPLEDAVDDYLSSLRVLYPYGDYFAVNVSSPNTPGLRELQDKKALDDLLAALDDEGRVLEKKYPRRTQPGSALPGSASPGSARALTRPTDQPISLEKNSTESAGGPPASSPSTSAPKNEPSAVTPPATTLNYPQSTVNSPSRTPRKPILVKIAPDLEPQALDELLDVCTRRNVDGLIATNTTLSRDGLNTPTDETGGLSGRPLFPRSLAIIRHIRRQLPEMPIIGVGGIMSPDDAWQMLEAGADLLQVYTGLIYKGPFFARELNRGILRGLSHIQNETAGRT